MSDKQDLLLPDGIDDDLEDLGLISVGQDRPDDTEEEKEKRGRAFFRNRGGSVSPLVLYEHDGILRWNVGRSSYGARRARRAGVGAGRIVKQYAFSHEGENKIATLVRKKENRKLREKEGLWRLRQNQNEEYEFLEEVPLNKPGYFKKKKILLFVHGTFSHCDTTISQINGAGSPSNRYGQKFLAHAYSQYDMVLAYNHATLSVSPLLNAFNLAALLRTQNSERPKQIDIICHSRGGLVARWFVEGFGDPGVIYKIIFVACPLGGTTLASPTHLRAGADLLANYSKVVAKAGIKGSGNGFFLLGSIIAKISQYAFTGLSKAPVFDLATAVIPGLMGQARIGNNYELAAMHRVGAWASHEQNYYSLCSNFEPPSQDIWKFWRVFNDTSDYMMTLGDRAVDLSLIHI